MGNGQGKIVDLNGEGKIPEATKTLITEPEACA